MVAAHEQATRYLQIARGAYSVIILVVLGFEVGWHVHTSDLQGGGHAAAQGVGFVAALGINLGVDVAHHAASDDIRGHPLRPWRGVVAHAQVFVGLQCVRRFKLINRQVARAAFQGLVAGSVKETGSAQSFRDVFLVVPAVEFGVVLDVHVGVDHQQGRAFLTNHTAS